MNVHFGSKGGGSSLHGDARPPVNGALAARQAQTDLTAAFIAEILKLDVGARVIGAGDFNEFVFVEPMVTFAAKSGLKDMDEVTNMAIEERYT